MFDVVSLVYLHNGVASINKKYETSRHSRKSTSFRKSTITQLHDVGIPTYRTKFRANRW
jgi:hypothetical protein